ncbi:MAG TPA: hypothetical protein VHB78_14630 [Vicinamibacterales bacterium]|nr:hypothetical protein [Vicinamibacterales bacterium]
MKRFSCGVAVCAAMLVGAGRAHAQQPAVAGVQPADVQQVRQEVARLKAELDAIRQQYDDRISQLEQRLNQLTGGPMAIDAPAAASATAPQEAAAAQPAPAPVAATPQDATSAPADQSSSAMLAGSSKVFNPDTSVIGNFLGTTGKNPFSTQPSMQLTEAELSLQAVVDPYARADFFLSATPEGLEVEEGYATFTSLPKQLLLKVGKMRAQFGKVNTLHTHAMPTADRPLVTNNLVGGEDGLSDSGVSLSKLIANPFVYLEATGEVFAGTGDVFQSSQRSRPTYVGHIRAYRDLSEDKNIDLGVSYAHGQTDDVAADQGLSLHKDLIGVDATFRYRPLRRAIYRRLNLRTELIWSRQQLPGSTETTAFGVYGLGEYQFAQRWYAGARIDRSGRALDGSQIDNGGSIFLTFWPTEFAQLRGQFRHTSFAEGESANEGLFQVNFAIGAHGAHAF